MACWQRFLCRFCGLLCGLALLACCDSRDAESTKLPEDTEPELITPEKSESDFSSSSESFSFDQFFSAQRETIEPPQNDSAADERVWSPDEYLAVFQKATLDEQMDLVSEMTTEAEDLQLANQLLQSELTDTEVKMEILSIFQYEDYELTRPLLVSALEDSSPEVVTTAIDIISAEGSKNDIPLLEPLISSPHEEVRDAAQDTLDYLRL